uniref:Putative secreted protein n=1 Tax=Ixodes ricinus TaxID=34613 RepID=A0A6B0UYV4_IXORI
MMMMMNHMPLVFIVFFPCRSWTVSSHVFVSVEVDRAPDAVVMPLAQVACQGFQHLARVFLFLLFFHLLVFVRRVLESSPRIAFRQAIALCHLFVQADDIPNAVALVFGFLGGPEPRLLRFLEVLKGECEVLHCYTREHEYIMKRLRFLRGHIAWTVKVNLCRNMHGGLVNVVQFVSKGH